MAATTFWVSTAGTNTADGLSYGNAWKDLVHAIPTMRGATRIGSTINVVNDGTHIMVVHAADYINSMPGTGWEDGNWGIRIRGTDASGDPALAELQLPNSNGTYDLWRPQVSSGYVLVEGLHFTEAAGASANNNVHMTIGLSGSSPQDPTFMFRYCSFDFDGLGTGVRNIHDMATYSGRGLLDHCYLRNVLGGLFDGGAAIPSNSPFSVLDCVIVKDQDVVVCDIAESNIQALKDYPFERNTIVHLITNTATTIANVMEPVRCAIIGNNGTGTFKDNLYFVGTKGDGGSIVTPPTIPDIAGTGAAGSDTFNSSDVDYNAIIVTPACTGSFAAQFPYTEPYGDGTGLAYKTNDVTVFDSTAVDVFNDIASTYAWTVGSYEIELTYDLRPALPALLTGGSIGGVIGALEGANQPPVAGNVTYDVTAGDVLAVNAANGVLSNSSDPDLDTLTCSVVTSPSLGTINVFNTTTGAFTYTPLATSDGTDTFTFKVYDGITWSASASAIITVDEYPVTPPGPGPPAITDVIDTAPFFKPDLRISTEIRFKSEKNRRSHHDLPNYTKGKLWEESIHRVLTLATNTTTQVTLGGVATAEYLMVETDRTIKVSINDANRYWTVSGVVAVALTEATTIYLQNESITNAAQVILIAVD